MCGGHGPPACLVPTAMHMMKIVVKLKNMAWIWTFFTKGATYIKIKYKHLANCEYGKINIPVPCTHVTRLAKMEQVGTNYT